MISSINASRAWPQQAGFKAFNDTSGNPDNPSPGSSIASLYHLFQSDSSEEDDDYGYEGELSSQFGSLQQAMDVNGADQDADGAVDDMSSKAFMKALQQKLDMLKSSADTSAMAETMQAAFQAGRLTVTDVVSGEQIVARDVTDTDTKPGEITAVATSEWSSFLRDNLLRDPQGRYVRNEDSSHIDKASGANSYFGMIAETHYYLTWTVAGSA